MKTQKRLLEFVNVARTPDEIADFTGIDRQSASQIYDLRTQYGPFGFRTLNEIEPFLTLSPVVREVFLRNIGPYSFGQWTTLTYRTQEPNGNPWAAAHSHMLHTGKVLLFPEFDTNVTVLWDPANERIPDFTYPDNQPGAGEFLYCSGHAFISEGRLLAVGGGGNEPTNAKNSAWIFDPDDGTNGTWTMVGDTMDFNRWYPTVLNLGYPRVLIASGTQSSDSPEIYNEEEDEFVPVIGPPGNPTGAEYEMVERYPGLHLLPTGKILYTHTGWGHSGDESRENTAYFEFTGTDTGQWTEMITNMNFPDRTEGMSVQILKPVDRAVEQEARVIVFGGGFPEDRGGTKVEAINTAFLSPDTQWQSLNDMDVSRLHASAVLLPDGKVLVFGGAEHRSDGSGTMGFKNTQIFDPESDTFSTMDEMEFDRGYHTITVLLPSGKVMVSGGINGPNQTYIEIFEPPYFFKEGSRPKIIKESLPRRVRHGDSFEFDIEMLQEDEIEKVVLVRPMSYTHHTDTEQRVLQLKFSQSGNLISATMPGGEPPYPQAPRGYYMLFILNHRDVPSKAEFIYLN